MTMSIKEIQDFQRDFDRKYFGDHWGGGMEFPVKFELIKDMTIALAGEVGEFANIVKKINRDRKVAGQEPPKVRVDELKEELVDCFIYIIILANLLELDLEKGYLEKTEKNHKRFQKYLKK